MLFNVSNSSNPIQQVQAFLPFVVGSYQAHLKVDENYYSRDFTNNDHIRRH